VTRPNERPSLQCRRRRPPFGPAPERLALLAWLLLAGGLAAAAEPQVAVVVLPPALAAEGDDKAKAAAELACDLLARELEKTPSLRIVDRSQLDRLLKEQRLAAGGSATIVSYDAMVRLEIDAARLAPVIRLSVVDLSRGNPVVESQHPWSVPLSGDVVPKMAQQCQAGLRDLVRPTSKAMRVRLLEAATSGASARLEPLAERLRRAFDNALQRSNGVLLVHHLEALTAKEESLLLTMGLSQLPGGRQFVPQSDATVELRIREVDGVGKTFEQTHVEVAWRVRRGQSYTGDWAAAAATVKEFDSLLKTAWARCADALGQASPHAAGDYLAEMALRRKQAQAELDAGDKRMDVPREVAIQHLAHVAAAAKLDPTWDEPAYRLVSATVTDPRDNACYDAAIAEALRYIQRFQTNRDRRTEVADRAFFHARNRFLNLHDYEKAELTTTDRLTLDALKEIIDVFVAGPPEELPSDMPIAMHFVYRGMTLTGVDAAERRRWMDQVVRLSGRNVSLATHLPSIHDRVVLEVRMRYRMHAARLLAEEGDPAAARPYVEELIPLMAAAHLSRTDYIAEQAYRCVEKMKAADLVAKLDAGGGKTDLLCPLTLHSRWPTMSPWGPDTNGGRPRVAVQALRYSRYTGAVPLAVCGWKMYCLVPGERSTDAPRVGFVDVDSSGNPAGKVELLPAQPVTDHPLVVRGVAVVKDRIYLGTKSAGLLEYDSGKGAWRTFGPKQGMPGWNVYSVMALQDGTVFCHVGDGLQHGFLCQVNPSTSEITMHRRAVHEKGRNPLADCGLSPAWIAGDRVVGFVGGSCLYTLPKLGAGEPVCTRWPSAEAPDEYYISLPDGMAVIAGRRFLLCRDALREIDDAGKVLRTWAKGLCQKVTAGPADLPGLEITVPSDVPDLVYDREYRDIAQDSSCIFFLSDWILCFDPVSDTWYGPLETTPWTSGPAAVASGASGVWFSPDRRLLVYVSTADFQAAARKVGRVITSEQWRARREESARSLPTLEQAKWALSTRQHEKARELCASVLDGDAGNVEALLVMAMLYEPGCLNQPGKAMEYYQKLGAVTGHPAGALAGLIHEFRLHVEAKRYADALRVGRTIQDRYPRNVFAGTLARYGTWLEGKVREPQEVSK
jgi:hypothetical protein